MTDSTAKTALQITLDKVVYISSTKITKQLTRRTKMKVAKVITDKKITRIEELLTSELLDQSSKIGAVVKLFNSILKKEFGTGVSPNLISNMFHKAKDTTPRAMTRKAKPATVDAKVTTSTTLEAVPGTHQEHVIESSSVAVETSPDGVKKTTYFKSREFTVVVPGDAGHADSTNILGMDNPGITRNDILAANEALKQQVMNNRKEAPSEAVEGLL